MKPGAPGAAQTSEKGSVLVAGQGHPLVGDPVYGGITPSWCERLGIVAIIENYLLVMSK